MKNRQKINNKITSTNTKEWKLSDRDFEKSWAHVVFPKWKSIHDKNRSCGEKLKNKNTDNKNTSSSYSVEYANIELRNKLFDEAEKLEKKCAKINLKKLKLKRKFFEIKNKLDRIYKEIDNLLIAITTNK